ncbi:hypothetical protein OAO01_04805 [Oligoflexia bacterium]|nr:hypothetical protein [Oligoflexia bacterium]
MAKVPILGVWEPARLFWTYPILGVSDVDPVPFAEGFVNSENLIFRAVTQEQVLESGEIVGTATLFHLSKGTVKLGRSISHATACRCMRDLMAGVLVYQDAECPLFSSDQGLIILTTQPGFEVELRLQQGEAWKRVRLAVGDQVCCLAI